MKELCKNLEVFEKTTKVYELQFKKNGSAEDITGWTVYFTVKENVKDSDEHAKIKKDVINHANPTDGIALIELTAEDTDLTPKPYYYDIKFKDDNGNAGILFYGRFHVNKPITQRG